MRRLGFNLIIGMAALLLALMAIFAAVGFGCLSLYLYLIALISAPLAALATAVAALIFALIVAVVARAITARPARRRNGDGADERDVLAGLDEAISLGKTLGLESRTFMTTHLSKAAIAVFGLGFAMGLSPRLRKFITNLLLR